MKAAMFRVAFVLGLVAAVSPQGWYESSYPHVLYECNFDDGTICDFQKTNEDFPMYVGATPSIAAGVGSYLYVSIDAPSISGYSEIELDIGFLADYNYFRFAAFRYSLYQSAPATLSNLTYVELRPYEPHGGPAIGHLRADAEFAGLNDQEWKITGYTLIPRFTSIRLILSVNGPFEGVLAIDQFQLRGPEPLPEPPTTTTEAALTEKECRMSLVGKVQQFGADNGADRLDLDNGKSPLTSTPNIPENPCRFLVVANVRKGKVQFVNLNFGFNPEYGQKHAVTIQVYVNGRIRYRTPGTSGANKITLHPMDGYTWSDGKTAVNIKGNKDTGYTITSESGCPYKFETKNANSMDDFFVAYVTPDGISDSGLGDKCGDF